MRVFVESKKQIIVCQLEETQYKEMGIIAYKKKESSSVKYDEKHISSETT